MADRRVVESVTAREAREVEQLVSRHQNISAFLGDWICKELESARREEGCHVFVAYLASPYRTVFAGKVERIFEFLLHEAADQCAGLRKNLTVATNQAELESRLAELEVACLLLRYGLKITVEPLSPKKGPDFKVALRGEDLYIEVKKLQREAIEQSLGSAHNCWTRPVSPSSLEDEWWNLHERYLVNSQFADDGYHVLAVDTSKRLHSPELMCSAWGYYCRHRGKGSSRHGIHVLVLCRREKEGQVSWLNDLVVGASFLRNPSTPEARNVLPALKCIFVSGP